MSPEEKRNSALCYEAIEIYRHTMVGQIRKCLNDFEKVRKLFRSDELNREITNANRLRESGKIKSLLKDEFDCLSVSHFYNIVNSFFEDIFPKFNHLKGTERLEQKKIVLSLVKEVKDYRDPVSHPSENDIDTKSAIRLVDSILRILGNTECKVEVDEANEIYTKLINCLHKSKEELDKEFKSCLEHCANSFTKTDYVRRPEIERKILGEKNTILVGASGAGKSTMLEMLRAKQAKQELAKKRLEQIPCLLKLVSNEDILQKVASEVGIADEIIEKYLNAGKLWIVFEAVDEMHNFSINFSHITDFIKRYDKNKYTISVRREYFENHDYKLEFENLTKRKERSGFEKVVVDPLLPEELNKLLSLRLGDQFSEESKAAIELFLSKLPEITPLLVEMAVEIYRSGGKLTYENEGKWFEQFFELKLKQECHNKKRNLGRISDILLDNVLIQLGENAIEESKQFFGKDFVYYLVKEEIGENISEHYDLLFYAEILKLVPVIVTTGKHRKDKEKVQFYHKTYRDFYIAKSLIGRLKDLELLKKIISNEDENETLVMLCGIEPQASVNDAIILQAFDADKIELSLECLCRTENHSFNLISDIANRLIKKSEDNSCFKKHHLLKYVELYGERICIKELTNYLEDVTRSDVIHKIDWEIYKSEKLGIGEISDKYKNTFRYVYMINKDKPKFQWDTEMMWKIAQCPQAQNEKGFELYYRLTKVTTVDELLSIVLDESIEIAVRAKMFIDLRHACRLGHINQQEIIYRLIAAKQHFNCINEEYIWEILPLYFFDINYQEVTSPEMSSKEAEAISCLFWNLNFHNIHLRILYNSVSFPKEIRFELCKKVLENYKCELIADLKRLEDLLYEEFYEEVDLVCNYSIVADYPLFDFDSDTYETLMKCLAMQEIVNLKISECNDLLLKYTFSENEKLRTVAEWALKQLEESKNE